MPEADTAATQIHDWPLWWFARLESALKRDDRSAAKEAIENLERLGIEVRFRLPPIAGEACGDR
jgi:hypothetical protein